MAAAETQEPTIDSLVPQPTDGPWVQLWAQPGTLTQFKELLEMPEPYVDDLRKLAGRHYCRTLTQMDVDPANLHVSTLESEAVLPNTRLLSKIRAGSSLNPFVLLSPTQASCAQLTGAAPPSLVAPAAAAMPAPPQQLPRQALATPVQDPVVNTQLLVGFV